ncbi:MAG TPA: molecular chaperone DnaJ [Ruminococcus sp.]|nr:molecular chaperone DnaJ [Ruminococcus sp.]
MKWFNNPSTLEELKQQYKKLALKHHPDLGGNTADMQEINNEYDLLFARLKNTHATETTETPDEFKNIINALINLEGINIELCGSWLWITGNTKEHKEVLKSLHFRWSKSKCAWYYHTSDYKKTSGKTYSLDQIRDLYGSETIKANPQLKLAII